MNNANQGRLKFKNKHNFMFYQLGFNYILVLFSPPEKDINYDFLHLVT